MFSFEFPRHTNLNGIFLRIIWILFSILILPSMILKFCNHPPSALFISSFSGLLGCILSPRQLGLRKISCRDIRYTLGAVAIILLSAALLTASWKFILNKMHLFYSEKQLLAEMISSSGRGSLVMIFAATCIFAPFTEEVLFRRMIFGIWRSCHKKSAFLGTSALFSLIHFFILGIPGLFFMGMAFQHIFLRRKNLWCACLAHCLVNLAAFAVNI